jgi:hypothetical protein
MFFSFILLREEKLVSHREKNKVSPRRVSNAANKIR